MTPWLDDGDLRLYHGHVLDVLAGLPDSSVDCVVTSPPYWGLRDYGTGEWDDGDPDCDHQRPSKPSKEQMKQQGEERGYALGSNFANYGEGYASSIYYRDVCGKCGARRVDHQLGLEPTPDEYVANMVAVFREVRRVLADHGTCWVNLGDSYASQGGHTGQGESSQRQGRANVEEQNRGSYSSVVAGLKAKDLVGIPWRVAFALQQDGWYLRSDIIWAKPNPMPESVTDRPTKSHEYVFLLTKRPRYWFDAEAVREKAIEGTDLGLLRGRSKDATGKVAWAAPSIAKRQDEGVDSRNGNPGGGRNVRSVWNIATQPYPEAHFATFPEELARRCILAGCPTRVCRVCGKPSERIVERQNESTYARIQREHGITYQDMKAEAEANGITPGNVGGTHAPGKRGAFYESPDNKTLGWSDCGHNNWLPGVVLDPFIGSGTVAKVARDHQRHAIGIDLSEQYLELAARRLQQLSLLSVEVPF